MIDELGSYKKYLPILKWRQGEYQALLRLDQTVKKNLYPLFVIPPVEFDFEEQKPKKTAEQHVEKLAKRYKEKWGELPSLVDIDSSLHLDNVKDGRTIPEFIFDELKSVNGHFSPVIQLGYDGSYVNAVKKSWFECSHGVGFRVSLDELADPTSHTQIQQLLLKIDCTPPNTDLIVDFRKGAEYQPTEDAVFMLSVLLGQLPDISEFRSIYVVGTSLELDLVKKPGAEQKRSDWIFYKSLHTAIKADFPNLGFGDYTIETPEFSSIDMRMMKPAAKLVYSYEDKWIIYKGGAFRDAPSQMKDLCAQLVKDPQGYFYGENYSKGDKKIYDCSQGKCGTGNLSTWKEAAVSHHLTLAVYQSANLNGFQTLT
ncbi:MULTISPECIES: beta family protein [Vibrio]|uniref:beta family protein n=1 Tax=Vibrio TaxID=662 RepID=UPI0018822C2A|nr:MULTISPECIES: beta family protein [Vibrio]MBE8568385.1 beta family protein [Vibrio sp. OPT46]MBE8580579.1 beta family protein [Vibrio sp. OPT41]MCQ9061322.1 beta family protein [Vibrio alginolyticus]MCS0396989.1 beta family protein [Vibrio diabolicus]